MQPVQVGAQIKCGWGGGVAVLFGLEFIGPGCYAERRDCIEYGVWGIYQL